MDAGKVLDVSSDEKIPNTDALSSGALSSGDRRESQRRQADQRREGLRGEWEDRRLFDRRKREYSMFGKRLDGIDDVETDISKVPDVPNELLLRASELEIFAEQDEAERTKNHHRRHDDEPVKRRLTL